MIGKFLGRVRKGQPKISASAENRFRTIIEGMTRGLSYQNVKIIGDTPLTAVPVMNLVPGWVAPTGNTPAAGEDAGTGMMMPAIYSVKEKKFLPAGSEHVFPYVHFFLSTPYPGRRSYFIEWAGEIFLLEQDCEVDPAAPSFE